MSTGLIIALIVIVAAVVLVAAALTLRARRDPHGGRNLKRRFGPEYERTLARHGGDAKAAERELAARVERHGALRERPLTAGERERFEARWTAAQERFVDAPREAVAEADRLIAELAAARGYPDGDRHDERIEALSVHHPHHVHGYRRVHSVLQPPADGAAGAGAGTEGLRAAMVEARALFEALLSPSRDSGRHRAALGEGRRTDASDRAPARSGGRPHLAWGLHRRQAKES
ncbi:hypothetical protein ACFOOM_00080 [Streptomyces echinoruber]|uniref:Secreted protein n=1 Tax=Streptomyces echinoruber TaxID=68898 RepID=A0A918QVX9_9ACTN|nr:hypothetical protein [Streptomyces echinoruber]GGZ74540.1 hypothetical protein GCM10010389_10280 [Streptomyces echinoruber]